jgi:hypothetical protein
MIADSTLELAKLALNTLCDQIYAMNVKAGWYRNPQTGRKIDRNPMEMLMLIVTEVAEGAEGFRKDLKDTHLPHHMMLTVEMADTLIRIFELIGYIRANPERFPEYKGLDLGRAFGEKIYYNGQRADHKLTNRAQPGGKKC